MLFFSKGDGTMQQMVHAVVRQPGEEKVVQCPCGDSHRFFTGDDGGALGLHVTSICGADPHYHKKMTEVYYVVEGSGQMELDGELRDVEPGTAILIPPGVVHRGIGDFKVVIVYDHPELHEIDTYHSSRQETMQVGLFDTFLEE